MEVYFNLTPQVALQLLAVIAAYLINKSRS